MATCRASCPPGEAFAAALGPAMPAEPAPAALLGLEHEYSVTANGAPADFRALIHGLHIDGRRLDPGDRNAYRMRAGFALTCDESEAEIASPPVPLRPGFTGEIAGWAETGRRSLERALGSQGSIAGYSTHISAAMPACLNDAACDLFARTFAPAFALVIERPQSQGVYVRPRAGRMELCGDFATGRRLAAATALGAGGARACAAALRGETVTLPPMLDVELLPGIERYGHRVRREAYGVDLYAAGRGALLRRVSGGTIAAQGQLEMAVEAAEAALVGAANRHDLAALRRMVRGDAPLGIEHDGRDESDHVRMPGDSPFGRAIAPRRRRRFAVVAVAATWDATVFRLDSANREAFACIPRGVLAVFLDRLDDGRLDAVLEAYLASEPRGRMLWSHAQTAQPALYDSLGDPAALVAPERLPLAFAGSPGVTEPGPATTRAGKRSARGAKARSRLPAVSARPAKSAARAWKALLAPFGQTANPAPGPQFGAPKPSPLGDGGKRPVIRWVALGAGAVAFVAAIGFAIVQGSAQSSGGGAATGTPTAVTPQATTATPGAAGAAIGTATPTASPSPAALTTEVATKSPSPGTAIPTATKTAADAATALATATPVPATATPTPTLVPSPSPRPTETPRPTPTAVPTPSPTASPTASPTISIALPSTVIPTVVKGGCTPTPGATC